MEPTTATRVSRRRRQRIAARVRLREVARILNLGKPASAHYVTPAELSRMERGFDRFTPEAAAAYDRLFTRGRW